MPDRSEKVERLREEAGEYELPYLSKSRVKLWVENPEHFRLKYLEGIVEEETEAMVRGTRIHESIEHFYKQVQDEYADRDRILPLTLREMSARLPDDRTKWADYITPYLSNFFAWETRRFSDVNDVLDYRPLGVEEEVWREDVLGVDGEPPWMGIADVVLPASGVPGVPDGDGAVIIDFKTGSVPDEQYRDEGIWLELAYYSIVFEEEYDVVATGAYYPREDTLLTVSASDEDAADRRENVLMHAADIIEACELYDGTTQFKAKEGPLCKWGPGDDEESAFYGVCSQCTWAVPINNRNTFEAMIDEGYDESRIADELGTSRDAVHYWKYKLDL